MKLLLVYPPFCTPTVMPYSISGLKGLLNASLGTAELEVKCLDLNARFHKLRFPESYTLLSKQKQKKTSSTAYLELLSQFDKLSRPVYSLNNKKVLGGKKPDCFDELLDLILKEKPDLVAFSLVYNSQCFYAKVLLDELAKRGIKIVIGGPADTSKLSQDYKILPDGTELVKFLAKEYKMKKILGSDEPIPDFSDYGPEDYLSKEIILPIKASSGCCYRLCAFCTHHRFQDYKEVSLEALKKTVEQSRAKHFFFIDDFIPTPRLLKIAEMLGPLNIDWTAELRPTRNLLGNLALLRKSGLKAISWGVESASPGVLKAIRKGTNPQDISLVLKEAREAGIVNIVFVMFGFPGETEADFIQTIDFLKANTESIDLVSTSIFGLQKGSYVYEHPEEFGIAEITQEDRTLLGDTISYTMKSGLQRQEARRLRSRYLKTILHIDKLHRVLNYFKEQVLLVK